MRKVVLATAAAIRSPSPVAYVSVRLIADVESEMAVYRFSLSFIDSSALRLGAVRRAPRRRPLKVRPSDTTIRDLLGFLEAILGSSENAKAR